MQLQPTLSLPSPPQPVLTLALCVQDYTLVSISAVAAHLVKADIGEDYGLPRLSQLWGHAHTTLDQVSVLEGCQFFLVFLGF